MDSGQRISGVSAREKIVDAIAVGAVLWAIGYAVAIILFLFVPVAMIGWIVLPLMTPVTVYAAQARLKTGMKSVSYAFVVAATWASIAVAFDYIFLVSAFNVQNYYDLDVFVYYALTFLIPVAVKMRYRKP